MSTESTAAESRGSESPGARVAVRGLAWGWTGGRFWAVRGAEAWESNAIRIAAARRTLPAPVGTSEAAPPARTPMATHLAAKRRVAKHAGSDSAGVTGKSIYSTGLRS